MEATQNNKTLNYDKLQKGYSYLRNKSEYPLYARIDEKIRARSYRSLNELDNPIYKSTPVNNEIEILEYPTGTTTLGIELEIEMEEDRERDFDLLKSTILEHYPNKVLITTDASVHNGYELLFKPTSYDDFKNDYVKLANLFKALGRIGYRSHDLESCGLHIHVGKNTLDDKMIKQINNLINNAELKPFFIAFSRRKANQLRWCKFERQRKGERYCALNYRASSQQTIEFRMFRGTLNPITFIAAVELVNFIVKLAQKRLCTPRKFLESIGKHKRLLAYINARGISLPTIAVIKRKALTAEEKLQRAAIKEIKRRQRLAFAYTQWVRASEHGGFSYYFTGSQESAFWQASKGNLCIVPVRIINRVGLFKDLNFSPIVWGKREELTRRNYGNNKMPDYMNCSIRGRQYLRCSLSFP